MDLQLSLLCHTSVSYQEVVCPHSSQSWLFGQQLQHNRDKKEKILEIFFLLHIPLLVSVIISMSVVFVQVWLVTIHHFPLLKTDWNYCYRLKNPACTQMACVCVHKSTLQHLLLLYLLWTSVTITDVQASPFPIDCYCSTLFHISRKSLTFDPHCPHSVFLQLLMSVVAQDRKAWSLTSVGETHFFVCLTKPVYTALIGFYVSVEEWKIFL